MDDLDRLFRRLVQNIRNGFPDYLTQPFEVSELYQNLVPYRHNRRELEIDTNQDYEIALDQLLAGERGYLQGDQVMHDAIQRELASPNPNSAIFREFAASRVRLNPEAMRKIETGGASFETAAPRTSRKAPAPASPPAPAAPVSPPWATRVSSPSAPSETATLTTGASPRGSPPSTSTGDGSEGCRYCGGTLPTGRRVVFCPNCGQNLMVQRCPACGTELELSWKYCITCGRGVASS